MKPSTVIVIGTAQAAVMQHDSLSEALRSGLRLSLSSVGAAVTVIDGHGETQFVSMPIPAAVVFREQHAMTT